MKSIDTILNHISQIEHGFKHIDHGAMEVMSMYSREQCYDLAVDLFKHEAYQFRMLATTLLGLLAVENNEALQFLKHQVSLDENWRVQEMLAKAFDRICKNRGYEKCFYLIENWLDDANPNVARAVTEGLRIWTSRPFFKDNPLLAIALLSKNKAHQSEYLRKIGRQCSERYQQKT